ncbi:beta-xylosidase [Streptomyces sp. NPDC090445]|uniref:beta-xylosidase n=1 Tax=Streptomyces sp. NPDC090445 TaxID=3365963 RepID=UPI0037F90BE7
MRAAAGSRRRAAAIGLAVLAAAAGGALSPPAAAEEETPPGQVEFPTRCLPPPETGLLPADGTTAARITVDRPAPRIGDTVTVTYRVAKTPAVDPTGAAAPVGAPAPAGRVLLGGAQAGEVAVTAVRPAEDAGPPGAHAGPPNTDPGEVGGVVPVASDAAMTGTFTVTAPGEITLTPGGYTLPTGTHCTPAGPSAPVSARLTVPPLPRLNLRSVSLAAAEGAPGGRVRVTGVGFTPGAPVTVAGRAGAAETADRAAAAADAWGRLAAELPVADRATTAVVAYEGPAWTPEEGSRPAAYTVLEPAPVPAPAPEPPGGLSMAQAGAAITLGAVGYGAGGAAPGRIGTVTVTDTRGGAAGWTLTGRITELTGPGGIRVPGASLTWAPSCTPAPPAPPALPAAPAPPTPPAQVAPGSTVGRCTPGSPGPVGPQGAVLASGAGAPPAGGAAGFTVDAEVSLHLPPYTPPGAYRAVLTLTLS